MWRIDDQRAYYESSVATWHLIPARPEAGLTFTPRARQGNETPQRWPSPWKILTPQVHPFVAAQSPLADLYIRGRDLVATYQPNPQLAVHVQLYWRAMPFSTSEMASGMELLLSVRTDRLDASATMNVTTMLPPGAERSWFDPATQSLHAEEDFPADERSESNRFPTAYVARGALEEYDYFEMIQPADFAGLSVAQQDDCRSTSWRLFPESLEKGVIRRARLSACLLPSGAPAQRVHQAYQQFLTAPLPLTT